MFHVALPNRQSGGAKCVTYCYSGKLFISDIHCWRYYKKLEKPDFFDTFKDEVKKNLIELPFLDSDYTKVSLACQT